MKPRIIVFSTAYYPFVGGAEIAIEEIAKRLRNDFDFYIITARTDRHTRRKEIRSEGTIFRVGFGTRFDKWFLPFFGFLKGVRLVRGCRQKTILFGLDISQGSVAALFVAHVFPYIPFILNIQYGNGSDRLKNDRRGMISKAFRAMLKRADYVTAISRSLFFYAREFGYTGGISVIHNGADVARFSQSAVLPDVKKKHLVITTSRLVLKNGIDILISAIAEVKKKIQDVSCEILGEGKERGELEKQAAELGISDSVRFLGNVSHENITEYLFRAEVFVRPSRTEGMGNSFIEALMAGLPIIGTPVGGILDIIENEKTGLFVRPEDAKDLADKIIRIFSDEDLKNKIINEGQKMVRDNFSWEKIAEQYKALFLSELGMRKYIVIATPLYPPDLGGPATYTRLLERELPKFGFRVLVANFQSIKKFPKIVRHIAFFFLVLKKSIHAKFIFAQDPVSVGLPAWVSSFILQKKFYLKIVGDYAWEQYMQSHGSRPVTLEEFQKSKFDWKTRSRRIVERFVARHADVVVVPSNYLKKIVLIWGVKESNITVIYNAFETQENLNSRENLRKILNIKGFAIISAGRLVPWKGFLTLIRLMARISELIPEARLYIIGNGPELHLLKEEVRMLSLEKIVFLVGALPQKKFFEYLGASDVFLLNTAYEGHSHVLLEAMALGIPVVTTSVGGNPEIIENDKDGILVEYNNEDEIIRTLVKLSQNLVLGKMLVVNAKDKVENFSMPQMIEKTKKLFSSC